MNEFREILQKAHDDQLIDKTQLTALTARFSSHQNAGHDNSIEPENLKDELDQPVYVNTHTKPTDSEAPRLIRGFHDVLITCGLVIAFSGVAALIGALGVFFGCWLCAEVLVKRQRLALPAVVLTIGYLGGLGSFVFPYLDDQFDYFTLETNMMLGIGSIALMLFPFYWRFRVPIALSMMVTSCIFFVMAMILLIISHLLNINEIFETAPFVFNLVLLMGAVAIFIGAMGFDHQDLARTKRWSDVAFWLHLIAAPMLLFGLVTLLVGDRHTIFWWADAPTMSESIIVLTVVLLMLVIGIVIDRRAFVTSGLLSLIAAVGALFDQLELEWGDTTSIALLAVGLFVLTFGVGWNHLRKGILSVLPVWIHQNVPPVLTKSKPV